jgi:hypothetical protein
MLYNQTGAKIKHNTKLGANSSRAIRSEMRLQKLSK